MTPDAVGARVAAVLAERDAVQANLLELDGSFGKQVLEGAALTGLTAQRWEQAAAALAGLWETFLAYSAVVDRVAVLGAVRRPRQQETAELGRLLSGGCVQLPAAPVPLARRDLAARSRPAVTLTTAVGTMRRAFAEVTEVTAAAEAVWAAAGPLLDAAAAELARARPAVPGLGRDTETAYDAAVTGLTALRAAVNTDPLALWQGGRADTAAAAAVRAEAALLAARVAQLDQVRRDARRRIDDLAAAAVAARADRGQALAAADAAAARVGPLPPPPAELAEPPLGSLTALAAAGQWDRLAGELDRAAADLGHGAALTAGLREAAAAAVAQRDELRGLLGAYKAKAARLGAAEDQELARAYAQAYGLLWTAPCDLAAASAAVAAYQHVIRATEGRQ